jgi:hypothetical protein
VLDLLCRRVWRESGTELVPCCRDLRSAPRGNSEVIAFDRQLSGEDLILLTLQVLFGSSSLGRVFLYHCTAGEFAPCLSQLERMPCCRERASLSTSTRCDLRSCGYRPLQCCHHLCGRLALPPGRHCRRCQTLLLGSFTVHRRPESRLSRYPQSIIAVFLEGGRHG